MALPSQPPPIHTDLGYNTCGNRNGGHNTESLDLFSPFGRGIQLKVEINHLPENKGLSEVESDKQTLPGRYCGRSKKERLARNASIGKKGGISRKIPGGEEC